MEHKSNFDGSLYRGGNKNNKVKKVKMKCNTCGHIGYSLKCPNDGQPMWKYKNPLK